MKRIELRLEREAGVSWSSEFGGAGLRPNRMPVKGLTMRWS